METTNNKNKKVLGAVLTNRYFYLALGALLVLVFLAQNNRPVTIDFFFWTLASANLLVLLLFFFVLGALSGVFGNQVYKMRGKAKRRQNIKMSAERARDRQSSRDRDDRPPSTPLH